MLIYNIDDTISEPAAFILVWISDLPRFRIQTKTAPHHLSFINVIISLALYTMS